MEHRWLTLFVNGEWTGNPDRTIRINGVVHNMDEYAKEHGIELPSGPNAPTKPKTSKKVNTDVKEKHEDMEGSHDSADTEVDGDGDSEGTE